MLSKDNITNYTRSHDLFLMHYKVLVRALAPCSMSKSENSLR